MYPNKYITVDDRIYVYYTLFNLPEIYLIACLIDYLSTVSTYVEYVGRELHFDLCLLFQCNRDRTAVKFGDNILSFRAIFNDVRNSVERVHMKVNPSLLHVSKKLDRFVFSLSTFREN